MRKVHSIRPLNVRRILSMLTCQQQNILLPSFRHRMSDSGILFCVTRLLKKTLMFCIKESESRPKKFLCHKWKHAFAAQGFHSCPSVQCNIYVEFVVYFAERQKQLTFIVFFIRRLFLFYCCISNVIYQKSGTCVEI